MAKELTLELFRDTLTINEEYKYKQLCKLLDQKYYSGGSSKQAQLKEWNRYCTFEKIGTKYKLISFNEIILNKIDGRYAEYKVDYRLKISEKDWWRIGVYKIVLGNKIYIGSTISKNGFRGRFNSHKQGQMQYTKELLDNGATFEVIEFMDGQSEVTIRKKEDEYIKQYRENSEWEVVNRLDDVIYKSRRLNKPKKKAILIKEDNYKQAVQILRANGLL